MQTRCLHSVVTGSADVAEENPKPAAVFSAIHHVMEDLSKSGVGKLQRNTQQNFQYRGVDDVMDALAPSLARHGLIIVPHVAERVTVERTSRAGGTLFHTLLKIDYDFIAVKDGSTQVVGPIYGEAMDSGDKSTNKAMATAYKYACVQAFCIPITGDDPDADTHDVVGAQETPKDDSPRPAEVKPSAKTPSPARPRPEIPVSHDGKPRVMRPTGLFGYGKKYAETPWSVMLKRDLEWFRGADRTPDQIRSSIDAELAWRDYETSQLDAAKERDRAQAEQPFDDQIP